MAPHAFHDPDAEDGMSTVMRQFVAGVVTTLREFTLMYAPTINAYRRFEPYFSNGMTQSWGYDNKSATVRCITESPSLTRLEQRTAGGDVNPYLVDIGPAWLPACTGIENELEAPAPILGDAYADETRGRVPTNIEEAVDLFEQSKITNKYLGEDFVRFFAHSRRVESACFHQVVASGAVPEEVTDWELARYFEMV